MYTQSINVSCQKCSPILRALSLALTRYVVTECNCNSYRPTTCCFALLLLLSVASPGLVLPVAASDRCFYPIFSSNNLTIFLVIASESDNLFCCRLLTTPILLSSHVVYPVFFLNSATKINFSFPRPPLVTPLASVRFLFYVWLPSVGEIKLIIIVKSRRVGYY